MSNVLKALMRGSAADPLYVDDVFQTVVRSGTGAAASVTTGFQPDFVWTKARNTAADHWIADSARGVTQYLNTASTNGQTTKVDAITSFDTTGYSLSTNADFNSAPNIYASWTFRKADKFHNHAVVTKSAGSNATVNFPGLGVIGMVRVKRTDAAGSWYVWHRSLSAGQLLIGETTAAAATLGHITVSGTTITLVNGVIADGTYLVEAFAHDSAADGIIQCGSFTLSGAPLDVSIGFEPQWLLIKRTDSTDNWIIADIQRSMANTVYEYLFANISGDATGGASGAFVPKANGFATTAWVGTYIYLAIRRSNKPPTSGTQVFQPVVYTGTNVDNRLVNTTIAPDFVMVRQRNDAVLTGVVTASRLTGNAFMLTGATTAEATDADSFMTPTVGYGNTFSASNGFGVGNDITRKLNANTTASNHVALAFKRAVGVFDVVCYTGTGSATTVAHGLGAVPEMMIVKGRSAVTHWIVYQANLQDAANNRITLSGSGSDYITANSVQDTGVWNGTAPTTSVFSIGSTNGGSIINVASQTEIAYLWATKPGISKVGSYTGNGTSQTIDCGFTTGARFVLIKQTSDAGGPWLVFDSARGIVAGNDPHFRLNTSDAEGTSLDYIDPDNSGFSVTSDALVNGNGQTFIYLAYA